MSFDSQALETAIAKHGPVARVVVIATKGSVPRGAGASMLVWEDGFSGTIGGGALEFEAIRLARQARVTGKAATRAVPLGPTLNQCCGGHVTWLVEIWTAADLRGLNGSVARPLPGSPPEMPFGVRKRLAALRREGRQPEPDIVEGWFVEPVSPPRHSLWVYGAGHVGRAIVGAMAPLPDWTVTWIDTDLARYPTAPDPAAQLLPAADPLKATSLAPADAHHLVLTYSHDLDLRLVSALLSRRNGSIGLIGSQTKWARFRRRLLELGHPREAINSVICPIGDPTLGKHPQQIALGVAGDLIHLAKRKKARTRGPGREFLRGEN